MSSSHSRRASSRRPRRAIAVATVLLVVIASAAAAVAATALGGNDDDPAARNVILFIGDGMGDSEITSARNYEYGTGGRLPGIDALPHNGRFTTHSLSRDGSPDYVSDSAATATAWATGTKTYDGAIGVDIDDEPRPTLLELAKKQGLRTGNVTTSVIQDATPAAQMAHVPARSCQGPEETAERCPDSALENGGSGSITEQLLRTRPDVTLGGGLEIFEEEEAESGEYAGVTLLEQAERRGYQLVEAGIAARLWLTDRTVETHVTSILSKLGLHESADEHRRVLAVLTWLGLRPDLEKSDGQDPRQRP